jgi:eukaryotic-like serine/threonine-protein kinase
MPFIEDRADSREARSAPPLPMGERGPDHRRFQLFDSINAQLQQASCTAPLLIVLDDCHCADAASMVLLKFIARDLRQSRIMLIVTYREIEARLSPFLPSLLAEIGREGQTISLRGMPEADVRRFIATNTGHETKTAVSQALSKITEGNPFFLGEIVRLLLAEGRLAQLGTRGLRGFRIPDGVRAAILRRVELVSPLTRTILVQASAIGREFGLSLLRKVSSITNAELESALDDAARAALIVHAPDSERYKFVHTLIPETLYDGLSRPARRELHQRIADEIEALYSPDLEPHLSELAHHHASSIPDGNLEKAHDYAARAAARAEKTFAYEEAARLYSLALRALESISHPDLRRRCELTLSLAGALYSSGEFDRSREQFETAAAAAIKLGDADQQAIAVLGLGMSPSAPGVPNHALIKMFEDALAALGEDDSPLRALVLARLAEELYWSDQHARRKELSLLAVEISRRTGDRRALIDSLYRRHIVLTAPDTTEERLAISTEILGLIQEIGASEAVLRAHYLRIEDLVELGQMEAVDREIEVYHQRMRELHQEHLEIYDLMLAMRALMEGRFEEAEHLALRGFETGQHRREGFSTQILAAQLSTLRREQGRLAELAPVIKGFTSQYPGLTYARCGLAFCYTQMNDRGSALEEFEHLAADDFKAISRNATWLASMVVLSEVCAYLGDAQRARVLYKLLLPYALRNASLDVYVCYGAVSHYLGIAAATAGEFDEAEAHFAHALEFNQRMATRPWIAHTRFQFAAMLLARNRPGDREKGIDMARLALSAAEALGMNTLADRVRELVGVELNEQAGPDGTVTILFTDIAQSTEMTERLGDLHAQEILHEHNAIIRQQVADNGGFEVKSIGDGFMIAFPSARRALLCAIAIQRAFNSYRALHPDAPLRVSIGLHTGEAIKERGDFYGKAVIMASRIGAKAAGDEILVSDTLKTLTESAGDLRFEDCGETELKGLAGRHLIHRVVWQ